MHSGYLFGKPKCPHHSNQMDALSRIPSSIPSIRSISIIVLAAIALVVASWVRPLIGTGTIASVVSESDIWQSGLPRIGVANGCSIKYQVVPTLVAVPRRVWCQRSSGRAEVASLPGAAVVRPAVPCRGQRPGSNRLLLGNRVRHRKCGSCVGRLRAIHEQGVPGVKRSERIHVSREFFYESVSAEARTRISQGKTHPSPFSASGGDLPGSIG